MTNREAEGQVYRCRLLGVGRCDGKGWHGITHHHPTGTWAEQYQPKYITKSAAVAAVLAQDEWRRTRDAEWSVWLDYLCADNPNQS